VYVQFTRSSMARTWCLKSFTECYPISLQGYLDMYYFYLMNLGSDICCEAIL
jgi:hypothetical protein